MVMVRVVTIIANISVQVSITESVIVKEVVAKKVADNTVPAGVRVINTTGTEGEKVPGVVLIRLQVAIIPVVNVLVESLLTEARRFD